MRLAKLLTSIRKFLTTGSAQRLTSIFQTMSEKSVTLGWNTIHQTPFGDSACNT